MGDDSVEVVRAGLAAGVLLSLEELRHVQLGEREADVAADLAGEVGIKLEALEVDT